MTIYTTGKQSGSENENKNQETETKIQNEMMK